MQAWLLEIMQCPVTSEPLRVASDELVNSLRKSFASKSLCTRNGMLVEEDFDGGLVNSSSTIFFPIRQDIPSLLPDEAISIPE